MKTRFALVLSVLLLALQSSAGGLVIEKRFGKSFRGRYGALPVVVLRGTDAERGEAHGYLCNQEIEAMLAGYVVPAARQAAAQSGITFAQFRAKVLATFACPIPYRRELEGMIRGIARAAGEANVLPPQIEGRRLDADDMLFANALPDWHGVACSSYAAWDDKTCMVGRNLDYGVAPALLRAQCVLAMVPDEPGRKPTLGIGVAGLVGTLTAMNDDGVTVAIHDAGRLARGGAPHTPRIFVLRTILERAKRGGAADFAQKLLGRTSPAVGANVLLVDPGATPPSTIMEWDRRRGEKTFVTVRNPRSGEPFLITTNHFRERAKPKTECGRYRKLHKALSQRAKRTVPGTTEAWRILRQSHAGGATILSTLILPGQRRWLPVFSRSTTAGTTGRPRTTFTWDDILADTPTR
ncbi:MAG: hypothetical protein KAI66_02130 [Lentisphaeria bacterium]|nr:hypothetical protein [Lentisphaeria bacterium]